MSLVACGNEPEKPVEKTSQQIYSDLYIEALAEAHAAKTMADMQTDDQKKLMYLRKSKYFFESAEEFKLKMVSVESIK